MLYRQIRRDSLFLSDIGIMDYSLILGVSTEEFEVDKVTHAPVQVQMQNRMSSTLADLDELQTDTTNPIAAGAEGDETRDPATRRTVKPTKNRSIYLSGDEPLSCSCHASVILL